MITSMMTTPQTLTQMPKQIGDTKFVGAGGTGLWKMLKMILVLGGTERLSPKPWELRSKEGLYLYSNGW
jgi:hypothetical protein